MRPWTDSLPVARTLSLLLLTLLLLPWLLAGCSLKQRAENNFVSDAEPDAPSSIRPGEPWRERAQPLPPWPKDADLVELQLDAQTGPLRYFIDATHLQVGPDQVVRYTLVAEGRGGARNLSVEGIRCTLRGSYKVYAYGDAGRFTALPDPQWQPLRGTAAAAYRQELARFHFCVERDTRPHTKETMLRSLRGSGGPGTAAGFQFD